MSVCRLKAQLAGADIEHMDVLIITPLFFGDASGASIYYQRLTALFVEHGMNVGVISDREAGSFPGIYLGLFPRRAGQAKSPLKDYASYALQNISYRKLGGIVGEFSPKNIIIHSSFYNFPGLFPCYINNVMKHHPDINFILDVRDRLVPEKRIRHFKRYDSIIVCSENIRNYLCRGGLVKDSMTYIPVIQEHLESLAEEGKQVPERYGLQRDRYIFYAGLIKEAKKVDVLLEAYCRHIRPVMPDIKLVLAGLLKTTSHRIKEQLQSENVFHLGNLPRNEIIGLMNGAALCVNLSPIEGFPRSSLEALALRRPVLLPPNVPEFMQYCPGQVATENDPQAVAGQMIRIIQQHEIADYPVEKHYPENQFDRYMNILA